VESLRSAGFSRADATHAVEAMGASSLRGYRQAGRRAWGPETAPELRRAVERDLEIIRSVDPRLAALYSAGIEQALSHFQLKRGAGFSLSGT
jgi:hypothetical protein